MGRKLLRARGRKLALPLLTALCVLIFVVLQHISRSMYQNTLTSWTAMYLNRGPGLPEAGDNVADDMVIPGEWAEQIASDLAPFADRNISRTDLDTACALGTARFVMRLLILNNTIYMHSDCWLNGFKHEAPGRVPEGHNLMMLFQRLLCVTRVPDVEMVVNYGDEAVVPYDQPHHVPVLSWSKTSAHLDIMIPYISFGWIAWAGNQTTKPLLTEERWRSKKDLAVWRGSGTGGMYTGENWRNKSRSILVRKCQQRPDLCDADMVGCGQCDGAAYEEMRKEIHMGEGPRFTEEQILEYKYSIVVDGNSAPSSRTKSAFEGDSLVLVQETENYEFFYSSLRPYKHYVPLSKDFEDLYGRIEWLRAHQTDAFQIVQNGQRFARKYLTAEKVNGFLKHLVEEYAKLQDFTPQMSPEYENGELRLVDEHAEPFKAYMGDRCKYHNL